MIEGSVFGITICKFEDCHAGRHDKCKGDEVQGGVMLFCTCECHDDT